MRFFYYFILPVVLAVAAAYSTEAKPRFKEGNLKIHVDGIPSEKGTIHIALTRPEDPKKTVWRRGEIKVDRRIIDFVFDKVPFGEWIISVFHDENNNGQLDRSPEGLPLESYGFSTKIAGKRDIASVGESGFFFAPHSNQINITVK